VLNIGLSLVISPLLFYCDYGAGNDIYDLAPIGVDLSEKADQAGYGRAIEEETGLDTAATYRILVPVANPSTQKDCCNWQ